MYSYTANPPRVFERLRAKNVAANPKKTKLGPTEVEYVDHLVFATGTLFTPEKRLKIMVKPLRDMIPLGKYQRTSKFIWTTETSAAFKFCQQAISNCEELFFLEDTAAPIL